MINVFKMDLYRMMKSFGTWGVLCAMVLMSAMTVLITVNSVQESRRMVGEMKQGEANGLYEDASYNGVSVDEIDDNYFDSMLTTKAFNNTIGTSANFLLLIAIFAAVFINGEAANGYLKNISANVKSRSLLIFTKMLCIGIFAVALIIVSNLTVYASQLIFLGTGHFSPPLEILSADALFLLTAYAFAALVSLITVSMRNTAGGLIIGIVLSTGFGAAICSLISMGLNKLFQRDDISLVEYTITNVNSSIPAALEQGGFTRIIIVAAAWLVACTVLSMLIYKKREVK